MGMFRTCMRSKQRAKRIRPESAGSGCRFFRSLGGYAPRDLCAPYDIPFADETHFCCNIAWQHIIAPTLPIGFILFYLKLTVVEIEKSW